MIVVQNKEKGLPISHLFFLFTKSKYMKRALREKKGCSTYH